MTALTSAGMVTEDGVLARDDVEGPGVPSRVCRTALDGLADPFQNQTYGRPVRVTEIRTAILRVKAGLVALSRVALAAGGGTSSPAATNGRASAGDRQYHDWETPPAPTGWTSTLVGDD